ncbi:MAG: ABC transporter ATP-binding protein [Eubacteriaceae bacterium]|nr:ABC transporter ATP-binding protein [Eubacteriaceae bacterium]
MSDLILEVKGLKVSFATKAGSVNAIRGVDLELPRGKTLAIVGESGSGKSVTAKAIMGILSSNGAIDSGEILFTPKGEGTLSLEKLSKKQFRKTVNGTLISMVFQDPMTSLDPTMSIGKQIIEGILAHQKVSRAEANRQAVELLRLVEIAEPEKRMKNYPHQLSGGMRQRVVIAIAISNSPQLLICDEPTTALDVTIQAKILDIIRSIQESMGISTIYITHDLGVVANVADFVAVMYAGKIVEKGTADEVFYDPRHPYTWGLLSAMPSIDVKEEELYTIPGSPPSLIGEVIGDAFAPRNAYSLNIDSRIEPPMFKVSQTHSAATWLLHESAPKIGPPKALAERLEIMRRRNG